MSERDLAALMWRTTSRGGGVVHVPEGNYDVFALNVWTLRYARRFRGDRQPAIRGHNRETAKIAHRMKSFARLSGPLIIPIGLLLRGVRGGVENPR